MNATYNLSDAREKVRRTTVNIVWRDVYLERSAVFSEYEQPLQNVHQEVAGLALKAGFNEINEEDAVEVVE
ncbi:hypothetical protein M514_00540 [Trichuris suis]|uniref:Uncharacterized protein n=1 Tax=Trichuris suis TaxID=68888 RepID=A0A085MM68_9BILA|nr:hypothetical protein M513_00540 [Trichuris suis]KFD67475.1 hypothetical protein M514_00540 [Trichuris suis]